MYAWERQGSHLIAFEGFGLCCLVGFEVMGLWVCGLDGLFALWVFLLLLVGAPCVYDPYI
jgi:hypothetical protein